MRQRPSCEGERSADPQIALWVADQAADGILRLSDVVEDPAGMTLQQQARVGHAQVPRRPLDQHGSDGSLKSYKRPADGRLRHPQGAGSSGDAAKVGDAREGAEVDEVEHPRIVPRQERAVQLLLTISSDWDGYIGLQKQRI